MSGCKCILPLSDGTMVTLLLRMRAMTETGQWSRNVDWRTRWRAEEDAPAQAAPIEISTSPKLQKVDKGLHTLAKLAFGAKLVRLGGGLVNIDNSIYRKSK